MRDKLLQDAKNLPSDAAIPIRIAMMDYDHVRRVVQTWENLRTNLRESDWEHESLYSYLLRVGVPTRNARWLPSWNPAEWVTEGPQTLPFGIDGFFGMARHRRFPEVLLVALNFLSEDFVDPLKNKQLGGIYADFHDPKKPTHYLSGTKKSMGWKPLQDNYARPENSGGFRLSGQKHKVPDHDLFLRVMEMILENKAGKPKRGEPGYIDLTKADLQPSSLQTFRHNP